MFAISNAFCYIFARNLLTFDNTLIFSNQDEISQEKVSQKKEKVTNMIPSNETLHINV